MNDYAPPPVSRYAPYPVNKDKIAWKAWNTYGISWCALRRE
jgi:hypothetical protein